MPKVNGHGQASILLDTDLQKIRRHLDKKYRLLLDIAKYTGERWGAILQLRVLDVYDEQGKPRDQITFRAGTRKADPNGKRTTRQVPVHSILEEALLAYPLTLDQEFLFPSPMKSKMGKPITLRAADGILRNAIEKAGLGSKGFSTHSTRRTLITRLWKNGVDLYTIQQVTGHSDLKTLTRYIENDPERTQKAIASL